MEKSPWALRPEFNVALAFHSVVLRQKSNFEVWGTRGGVVKHGRGLFSAILLIVTSLTVMVDGVSRGM